MNKWHCGVTSQCLVTPAVTYSFTETYTIAGILKCEWYLFCTQKASLPPRIQPFLPNIHKAKYIETQAIRILELNEEFGCVCRDSQKPNLGITKEVLYVEMQTYHKFNNESLWLRLLADSIAQRRECIYRFIDSLPSQLATMVVEDNSINNLLLDQEQLVLIDPVFSFG